MNTYTLKPTTTEDFIAAFLSHSTKISGEPTGDDICLLRTILNKSAASVHSSQGGGLQGHLGMVMDAATFATISPTAWEDPPEPPVAPNIVAGATGPQISMANCAHAQTLSERREFQI